MSRVRSDHPRCSSATWICTVADRGVGEWGSCLEHQGTGHQRGEGERKNNVNLHNEKHVGAQSGNLAQGTRNQIRLWICMCGHTRGSISALSHYFGYWLFTTACTVVQAAMSGKQVSTVADEPRDAL